VIIGSRSTSQSTTKPLAVVAGIGFFAWALICVLWLLFYLALATGVAVVVVIAFVQTV
jgi:hypothetical protein